jgi:hypothetical protein
VFQFAEPQHVKQLYEDFQRRTKRRNTNQMEVDNDEESV